MKSRSPDVSIDHEKWIKALEEIQKLDPSRQGLTCEELSISMNRRREWVLTTVLGPLIKAGRAVCLGNIRGTRIDGVGSRIPVYVLKTTDRKQSS